MGNRGTTIVQLTCSPLIKSVLEYLNMLSHNYLQSRTHGDMKRTETRQKRKTKRMKDIFFFLDKEVKLKRHDTRGLQKCNLSASEGHSRNIYSLYHEETYFCHHISAFSLWLKVSLSSVIRLCPCMPSVIRAFFNVDFTDAHIVKNSELDAVELGRLLSDYTVAKIYYSNGFYEGGMTSFSLLQM